MLWQNTAASEPAIRIRGLSCRPAHLGAILSAGALFVLPIVLADTCYMDDAPRTMDGYGWTKSGRPLASLLMAFLGFRSRNLPDLAPLGQLAGIAFLSFAAWVFAARLFEARRTEGMLPRLACALPVFMQPFFLENLSYRYDCLPMSLAQGLGFLAPALFCGRTRRDGVGICTSLLAILTLYQIGIDSFAAAVALIFIRRCQDGDARVGLQTAGFQIACMVPALLVYRVLIAPFLRGTYTNDHDRLLGLHDGLVAGLSENVRNAVHLLGCLGFDAACILLYGLFAVAAVAVWSLALRTGRNGSLVAGLLLLASPFVLILSAPGLTLLLRHSIIEPRTMMGFSGVMILIGLMVADGQRWMRVVAVLPLVFCLTLSFAYGNAMHERNRFDDGLALSLADRLFSLGFTTNDQVMVYGKAPRSPAADNATAIFPALASLLPRDQLDDDGFFGTSRFQRNGLPVADHDHADWLAARAFIGPDTAVYRDARYSVFRHAGIFCVVFAAR